MARSSLLAQTLSIVVRLPPPFLIVFLVLFATWTFFLFKELSLFLNLKQLNPFEAVPLLSRLDDILIGVALVILYAAGVLIVYNCAVFVNIAFNRKVIKAMRLSARQPRSPVDHAILGDRLKDINKIGIVLAGGGAKGAFQAGAM